MKEINLCGQHISLQVASYMLDQARELGYSDSQLRWRFSLGQRHSVESMMHAFADPNTLLRQTQEGFRDHGMFCGIPYITDSSLNPGVIQLEKIEIATKIGEITSAGVQMLDQEESSVR